MKYIILVATNGPVSKGFEGYTNLFSFFSRGAGHGDEKERLVIFLLTEETTSGNTANLATKVVMMIACQ